MAIYPIYNANSINFAGRTSMINSYGFSHRSYKRTEGAGVVKREVYGTGYAIWVLAYAMIDLSLDDDEIPIWLCVYSTDLSKIGNLRTTSHEEMAKLPTVGYIPDSPVDLTNKKSSDDNPPPDYYKLPKVF